VKNILLRGDGNSQTGLGHLYRLLAVSGILGSDANCVLITCSTSVTSFFPSSVSKVYLPEGLPANAEAAWIQGQFDPREWTIVADGYQFSEDYQRSVKEAGYKLMYIDDLMSWHMHADIVLNHSPAARLQDYSGESYTRFALGPEYALLRPRFIELAASKRKIDAIKSVLICFGGADPLKIAALAVASLSQVRQIETIHLVSGAADSSRVDDAQDRRLAVHNDLGEREFAELMLGCDMAIVSTSTVLFEACCVKMPVVTAFYADNQEKAYYSFTRSGLAVGAGDMRLPNAEERMRKAITETMSGDIDIFVRRQAAMFTGEQARNIKKLLLN
jgi:UDP-2,4-diacetamido-2,4,6-trideoxy-beta-L-altropyranose hydrolase